MEPYYRKFHTFNEPLDAIVEMLGLDYLDRDLHRKSSPIQVTFGDYQTNFDKAWISTFQNLGRKAKRILSLGCVLEDITQPRRSIPQQ